MDAGIERLAGAYPLGPGWEAPELVEDSLEIDGRSLRLVGLAARKDGGASIAAGAAGFTDETLDRSYFELLERAAALAGSEGGLGDSLSVWTREGTRRGELPLRAVFPSAPPDRCQRHSLSNGVAAHPDWARACSAAYLECIERDRVLRSWYGTAPPPAPLPEVPPALLPLGDRFEIDVRLLEDSEDPEDGVHAVGIFLFPRTPDDPFCCGFGADRSQADAIRRAEAECLQRLGFLSGEALPDTAPELSPTPDYHLDFFLYPPHQTRVKRWLDRSEWRRPVLVSTGPRAGEPVFADLTPRHLVGRVSVVRAIARGRLPLVFGEGHPMVSGAPAEARVHPVA